MGMRKIQKEPFGDWLLEIILWSVSAQKQTNGYNDVHNGGLTAHAEYAVGV